MESKGARMELRAATMELIAATKQLRAAAIELRTTTIDAGYESGSGREFMTVPLWIWTRNQANVVRVA